MKFQRMKQGIALWVCVCFMLPTATAFAAHGEVTYEREVAWVSNITAECSFDAELDDSFRGTWLYDLTENGKGLLHMKIQQVDADGITVGGYLATIGDQQYFYQSPSDISFGQRGTYEFLNTSLHFDGKVVRSYSDADEEYSVYLRVFLEEENNRTKGSLYLHHGNVSGNGITPATSVIPLENIQVSGRRKNIVANATENGDKPEMAETKKEEESQGSNENIVEDKTKDENSNEKNDEKTDVKEEKKFFPSYLGWISDDDEIWNDKEKSIELYGKYKDDEGVFHYRYVLRGKHNQVYSDYTVDFEASFSAYLPKAELSSDGNVTLTYYNVLTTDTKKEDGVETVDKGSFPMVKISGDLGEKWYKLNGMDVRRDPNVIYDSSTELTDDKSICVYFVPTDSFNGEFFDYAQGASEDLKLLFQFSDDTKTKLNSVRVTYKGRQNTINFEDINYKGSMLTYFLNLLYPGEAQKYAKEMGLTI